MKKILIKHNLVVFSLVALSALIYIQARWQFMPASQLILGLFTFGIILPLWDKSFFSGGFTELIAEKLGIETGNVKIGRKSSYSCLCHLLCVN